VIRILGGSPPCILCTSLPCVFVAATSIPVYYELDHLVFRRSGAKPVIIYRVWYDKLILVLCIVLRFGIVLRFASVSSETVALLILPVLVRGLG
jgi:hypothetical protein